MQDNIEKSPLEEKTFTGIQSIFGSTPFHNVLCRNPKETEDSVMNTVEDTDENPSLTQPSPETSPYVTCEKFHGLNKNADMSCKSLFRSTSTIFYDLDEIAKRHSYHGMLEVCTSNADILKAMKLPTCGFRRNMNPIVQECTTLQPNILKPKDSMECNTKKLKKKFPHNDVLSSEIFLRDKQLNKRMRKNLYYNTDVMNRQRFWSYVKYQTEYTKPMSDKKSKKKDNKGKRTDDPCPCQLFSYACPCTDEKSLTELAKSSKCSPAVDKITSATVIVQDGKKRQNKKDKPKEEKGTGVTKAELETEVNQVTPIVKSPSNAATNSLDSNKIKKSKKIHRILCPNCKENVEALSITEDESIKGESLYASKELASTAAYNCSASSRSNRHRTGDDVCNHQPRCELIPVCQILPTNETYDSLRGNKKRISTKSVPKVIRITKACRHHPPCTVVPSCQRANVLRNNCEFIPPCLHRPRCVNLPLCVPLPKNINYDELLGKYVENDDSTECNHIPKCKLVALCQESLAGNAEHHYNCYTPSICNHKDHNPSTYIISPKSTFLTNSRSPERLSPISPNSPCSISNKSCQFSCYQCKLNSANTTDDIISTNGIIYIRDVGCQFHNIQYSPIDSLAQYKTSSASFDNLNIKTDRYYANAHTLRCEDKCTNVVLEQDPLSTDSVLSREIDSNCPSHGRGLYKKRPQDSGFRPNPAYVAAYAQVAVATDNQDLKSTTKRRETYTVKSRSFFKGKCRKFFLASRKGSSNRILNCISRKLLHS